jgi:predicted Zn-dependent protease with MMP-like domain
MMADLKGPIDQGKVVQVADTLKQGFPGDAVLDSYSEERLSQFYRIYRGTALTHRIYVSKEFLDDHTTVQIDQLLQKWGAVDRIRDAGARLVTINNHGIQTASE